MQKHTFKSCLVSLSHKNLFGDRYFNFPLKSFTVKTELLISCIACCPRNKNNSVNFIRTEHIFAYILIVAFY